jgi:hypothetical protein
MTNAGPPRGTFDPGARAGVGTGPFDLQVPLWGGEDLNLRPTDYEFDRGAIRGPGETQKYAS